VKPKATAFLLTGIWLLYAIVLNMFISNVWWGLYQEDLTTRLFAMSLTSLPFFILGLPVLFIKSKSEESLQKDETVIMSVITAFVTGTMVTLGYIGDLSKNDWFAYLIVILVTIFMLILYLCMAANMKGGKKLSLFLAKCFVISFIPAIFIALLMTSLILILADNKILFIIVYVLASAGPPTVTIIFFGGKTYYV